MTPPRRFRSFVPLALALTLGLTMAVTAQDTPPEGPPPAVREAVVNRAAGIRYLDPIEFFRRGGPLMWPILLCSIATVTFGLERFVSLRFRRVIPAGFVRRLLDGIETGAIDRARALEICRTNPAPIAGLFYVALRYWGRPFRDIEQAVQDAGSREVLLLRRNLRALSGTANIATLLGLLGTVTGMIDAFNAVATGGGLGRAEVLANGIAMALLTTVFGLIVAIPGTLLYNYFAGRIERLVYEMDVLSTELIDLIAAESPLHARRAAEREPPRAPAPPLPVAPHLAGLASAGTVASGAAEPTRSLPARRA
jgi:biopolymer transport protein ExbB